MLRELADRLADDLGPKSVADLVEIDVDSAWSALAGLGLLSLRAPAAAGGGDSTTVDVVIVAEALAAGLLAVPFLGAGALATELLLAGGAPESTLAQVAKGELLLAVAVGGGLDGGGDIAGPAVAPDGAGATAVLVLEDQGEGDGPRLVALAPGEAGAPLDLTRCWVRPDPGQRLEVGDLGGPIGPEALGRFECRALALLSADLVGLSAAALSQAVDYAQGRIQFGSPIGSFQAVQHLCAEQAVTVEGARALTHYAAWAADELSLDEALLSARTAKAYCSKAGKTVTEAVVQVFGGMGITWECLAHVALKRALVDAAWFGDEREQLQKIARLRARMAA